MQKSLLALLCFVGACGAEPAPPPSPPPSPPPPPSTANAEPAPAPQPKIVKRVVVDLSRKAGTNVTMIAPDGTITVSLDVLENGRGPHTDATVRLAKDGTIASLDARGHHEMGTPVAENFSRDGDHVKWKSHEENGSRDVKGGAFFVPVCDLPDAIGWLAKALLDSGGSMPLLPGGKASIEKTVETTVKAGGEERRIVG